LEICYSESAEEKEGYMDLLDVIKSRRSIRAFKPERPSKALIAECLEAAAWAPSASNLQPWEFVVLAGEELEKVGEIIMENFAERSQGFDSFADIPEEIQPRQAEIMQILSKIARDQGRRPTYVFEQMMTFFDAPVGVYFVTYKRNDNQYEISIAAAIENFLLAAQARGLGTCWLTTAIICEDDIKPHLGLADNRQLVAGVALGYPDETSPLNRFERPRASLEEITTWLGF
jgi:nitroreductase